jgi:NADPH2:quinone reductase
MLVHTGDASAAFQLRSLVRRNGELELSLASVEIPAPKPDEVAVRVEASPISRCRPATKERAWPSVLALPMKRWRSWARRWPSSVGPVYWQYRCIKAEHCLALPEGTTRADGASCFINPLTRLRFAGADVC